MWCTLTAVVDVDLTKISSDAPIIHQLLKVDGFQVVDGVTLKLDDTRNLLEPR